MKPFIKSAALVVVSVLIGALGMAAFGGPSFQGVSHLSGLAVGADGLSTENGGTAAFGTTVSVGTTLTVGTNATVSGSLSVTGTTTDNGVERVTRRTASLNAASTTVCALMSHPTATSTLEFGGVNFDVSSTSASVVTIGKASTPYATTTWLTNESISANAQASIGVPATTTSSGMAALIFAPATYMVVGMQGGVGTFSPSGVCSADFRSME